MGDAFIVKNNSGGSIELKDFGVVIPDGVTIELCCFQKAILSSELDGFLASEDLARVINEVEVAYAMAYTPECPCVLSGTDTIANGTSSKTVTIGITMADANYRVTVTPSDVLATVRVLIAKDKSTTQFDVETMSGANVGAALSFEWRIGE